MASDVATMQPANSPKPNSCLVGQRQRLGQAAGLVELDVDEVVACRARRRARRGRARFRRRRPGPAASARQRANHVRPARAVRPGPPRPRRRRRNWRRESRAATPRWRRRSVPRPARRRAPPRAGPRRLRRPVSSSAAAGRRPRRRPRPSTRAPRPKGVGGDAGCEAMQAGELIGRNAGRFRVKVPQGAIQRVARRPGRQKQLQGGAVGAASIAPRADSRAPMTFSTLSP